MAKKNSRLKPVVAGPPAYGSPDPRSAAGILKPVKDHPFATLKSGDDELAISEDYGQNPENTTEENEQAREKSSKSSSSKSSSSKSKSKSGKKAASKEGKSSTTDDGHSSRES